MKKRFILFGIILMIGLVVGADMLGETLTTASTVKQDLVLKPEITSSLANMETRSEEVCGEWVTIYASNFKMYSPDGDVWEYDGGNTDQLFFYKQLNLGNGATIAQVDEGSSNYIVSVNGLRDTSLSAGTVIADSDGDLSSVTGLTDNSSYWMCTASDCSTTCQVTLENGLITGCS